MFELARLWRQIDWTHLWRVGGWLGVALTLAFSLGPPTLGEDDSQLDKLAHLAGYALLMFWWAQLVVTRRWRLALAVMAFGGAIELLQGLTPERQPDPVDALANAAGVMLGWGIARLLPNLPGALAKHFRPR
ncbi:MAG: VanZ family protein [Pseudomonadota bacterium]